MTRVEFALMREADLPQVDAIERLSFPIPWGITSYRYELTQNSAAHFIVLVSPEASPPPLGWLWRFWQQPAATRKVLGYAGFWLAADEAHIGTIAIHPQWRGHGLGEQLLVALLHRAVEHQASAAHLEVRVSNQVAQNLYRQQGFVEVGRRKQYYRDNHEDALLMTAQMDPAFSQHVREKFRALQEPEKTS